MPNFNIQLDPQDVREFKRAIKRYPLRARRLGNEFFTKTRAELMRKITRHPWEVGGMRGGAPVDTGRLRDSHRIRQRPWALYIFPTADYSRYVHEGTSRMEERPWLNYAVEASRRRVEGYADDMLKKLVSGLAD